MGDDSSSLSDVSEILSTSGSEDYVDNLVQVAERITSTPQYSRPLRRDDTSDDSRSHSPQTVGNASQYSVAWDDYSSDDSAVTPTSDEEASQQDEAGGEPDPFAPSYVQIRKRKRPVFFFRPVPNLKAIKDLDDPDLPSFGFVVPKSEAKLIKATLTQHGFRELHPNSSQYNVMWLTTHVRPYVLQTLGPFQKVNHFPRSYELTRKDRLYHNLRRMQQTYGFRHFNIIPRSFAIPEEYADFYQEWSRDKKVPWISKPVASSCGRGITIVTHPNNLEIDGPSIVSRYIPNPLLVDGFKFDIRLYVAVTSYDPPRIYLYEDGLARFATVKYKGTSSLKNSFMHLTNYSINKKSASYVSCSDANIEDFGNKWSFSALLQHLEATGVDTGILCAKIEDVIIKTILAGQLPIGSAAKTFMPHPNACFELFGFDVLVDEDLTPWLLEVNLSPSLACDSPLDQKIKSHLIADLFNLALIQPVEIERRQPSKKGSGKANGRPMSATYGRPKSASMSGSRSSGLSAEHSRMLGVTKDEEVAIEGSGFQRIFPTECTWQLYSSFMEDRGGHCAMLHEQLYPESFRARGKRPVSAAHSRAARATGLPSVPAVTDAMLQRLSVYSRNMIPRFRRFPDHLLHSGDKSNPKPAHQSRRSEGRSTQRESSRPHPTSQPSVGGNGSVSKAQPVKGVDVSRIIEAAGTISTVQARAAFSTYLTRVRDRMAEDSSGPSRRMKPEKVIEVEDQIALIIRFLRKAASNLPGRPFAVVEPHAKLSLRDRQHLLSKQLTDFVQLYNKESARLKQAAAALSGKENKSNHPYAISDSEYARFLANGTEVELEELLTSISTNSSQSNSVFLGENPAPTTNTRPSNVRREASTPNTKTSIVRRETSTSNSTPSVRREGSMRMKERPNSAKNPASSSRAVHSSSRSRPVSARTPKKEPNQEKSAKRPSSARKPTKTDDDAIAQALRRLTDRQAARERLSRSSSSLIDVGNNDPSTSRRQGSAQVTRHSSSQVPDPVANHLSALARRANQPGRSPKRTVAWR